MLRRECCPCFRGGRLESCVILFFDRDIGKRLPEALERLRFHTQHHQIHYHLKHFAPDADDDVWLPIAGKNGWTVIGHDQRHGDKQTERDAIQQYNVGCFSIWGASNTSWEKMQCFANAYGRIVELEAITPRPFIFNVSKAGRFTQIL
jgi:hypothetical protein